MKGNSSRGTVELAQGCAQGVGTVSRSPRRTVQITKPLHTSLIHTTVFLTPIHSITLSLSCSKKRTQLDFRLKIYQLSNFSTEKIAVHMPYLFRRRCPLVLIVLVALVMETLVCLESDGRA